MNVLIYRLPRNLSVVKPPSHCTSCGKYIRFYDNIPLISWFVLRGKCRHCGAEISIKYPVTELLAGLLVWAAYWRFDLGGEFILAVLLIMIALTAGFVDLYTALDEKFECGIIPDTLIMFGLIAGFVSAYVAYGDYIFSLYGALAGFLSVFIPAELYRLFRKKEGMGFGDMKLMAVFGAFLGIKSIFFIVFLGALLLAAVGIVWQKVSGRKDIMVPMGPFLSIGALTYLFFAPYLNRFLFG